MTSSPASVHLLPSVAAVSLLPPRVFLQLSCSSGGAAPGWRRSRRLAVVRAANAEAVAPAYTSDSLILYFKAEGTMEERAIPKITESLEGIEGVKDLEVLIEEGIASVVAQQEKEIAEQVGTGASSKEATIDQGAIKVEFSNEGNKQTTNTIVSLSCLESTKQRDCNSYVSQAIVRQMQAINHSLPYLSTCL